MYKINENPPCPKFIAHEVKIYIHIIIIIIHKIVVNLLWYIQPAIVHSLTITQKNLRDLEGVAICDIEAVSNISGQFHVLDLIISHRYMGCPV